MFEAKKFYDDGHVFHPLPNNFFTRRVREKKTLVIATNKNYFSATKKNPQFLMYFWVNTNLFIYLCIHLESILSRRLLRLLAKATTVCRRFITCNEKSLAARCIRRFSVIATDRNYQTFILAASGPLFKWLNTEKMITDGLSELL